MALFYGLDQPVFFCLSDQFVPFDLEIIDVCSVHIHRNLRF